MRIWLAGLTILAISLPVHGQFKVHQWTSFENARLPQEVMLLGPDPGTNVQVVDFSSLSGMPEAFRSPTAVAETGRYGLRLRAAGPQRGTVGLAVGQVLDRDMLGEHGRAIYQADFFIPEGAGNLPSLAVLAAESHQEDGKPRVRHVASVQRPFYRWGMTLGKSLYFSKYIPNDPQPPFYTKDAPLLDELPRPGWHRFAIVFDGPSEIRTYIDGRESRFSPLKMPDLRKLQVGVMLADGQRTYDAYVDNLSIQVSIEPLAIPPSPYTQGWRLPPGPTALRGNGTVADASSAPAGQVVWQNPVDGWKQAQASKRPLLLYFHAPGAPECERFDGTISSDPEVRRFFAQHVAVRLDVTQVQASRIAQQYSVAKVPTLLVISPDASRHWRATVSSDQPWRELVKQLRP